jgi:hypothetical protein
MSIAGKIIRKVLPKPFGTAISSFKILEFDYGHAYSAYKWSCVDKDKNPIPWYTYPAIEYLKQFNFSQKYIFEYGSGNSTLFWSKLAQKVTSIENNKQWYEKIARFNCKNSEIQLILEKELYIQEILNHEKFDVIIIDGLYRYECAKIAITKLKEGGLIILDNSDWHVKTAKLLNEANLIQVNMTGFGPINYYTWTTSLFFHRKFNFELDHENSSKSLVGTFKQYVQE